MLGMHIMHVPTNKQLLRCLPSVNSVCVQSTASRVTVPESQVKSPLEKHHADAVVNFLLRIACQVRLIDDPFFLALSMLYWNCEA